MPLEQQRCVGHDGDEASTVANEGARALEPGEELPKAKGAARGERRATCFFKACGAEQDDPDETRCLASRDEP
eukprot:CAMPEP_0119395878 /NCGR_PEP_ID=MMETSP1334-20130426/134808_1 /TAXON_ID=127549 /ORGANISM="Calcidiscus leptoporus, Strain RCC1130" /LENGTH=72 /DNA_ID=CAMNT_0007419445 /DNA_START=67 /DNA_END=281 /DNA_ORIENTATION=-